MTIMYAFSLNPKMPTFYSPLKTLFFLVTIISFFYLIFFHFPTSSFNFLSHAPLSKLEFSVVTTPTSHNHILFSVASSSRSFPSRKSYIRLWYSPNSTCAVVFLDRPLTDQTSVESNLYPPVVVSGDTSRFPYTYPKGHRSAIRIARIVKEAVDRNELGIRWFVFGDDDTVFFVDNLVSTLSKYDYNRWFYIGEKSEIYEHNEKFSFDMAFGGGGFAISHALAKVVSKVLDSCLLRYGHLYGSDARIFSCLAELGVGLTHESGFHQVDVRGNLFGMLSSHPLSPILSLHHLDYIDPLFPKMTKPQALDHLFKAVLVDPARIFQQSVCYDQSTFTTISISWGYSIQVYDGNLFLPDLLLKQKTFMPWTRSRNTSSSHYMFNTREFPKDPCKRPTVFFWESVVTGRNGVLSNYRKHIYGNCSETKVMMNVELIKVFSRKLEIDIHEVKVPRRQCCEVLSSFNESLVIKIRHCEEDELISMSLED